MRANEGAWASVDRETEEGSADIFSTDTSERKVKVGLQIPVLSVNTPSTLWEQGHSAQKRACKDNKYEHTRLNVQKY